MLKKKKSVLESVSFAIQRIFVLKKNDRKVLKKMIRLASFLVNVSAFILFLILKE